MRAVQTSLCCHGISLFDGLPMINGNTPQQEVALVVAALQKVATRKLVGYPGGARPSRLVITLQRANLASEQARVMLGSDSTISGTARPEDIRTGQLIAQNPQIYGEDRGVKGYDSGASWLQWQSTPL